MAKSNEVLVERATGYIAKNRWKLFSDWETHADEQAQAMAVEARKKFGAAAQSGESEVWTPDIWEDNKNDLVLMRLAVPRGKFNDYKEAFEEAYDVALGKLMGVKDDITISEMMKKQGLENIADQRYGILQVCELTHPDPAAAEDDKIAMGIVMHKGVHKLLQKIIGWEREP